MKHIQNILCFFGLHSWEHGAGWIHIGENVQAEFKGYRCTNCHDYKGAPELTAQARAYEKSKGKAK